MNKINYANEMQKLIGQMEQGAKPRLLLHACCAPCSSACLEQLTSYFDITILYYNPNISPKEEFQKRYNELIRLTEKMPCCKSVQVRDIGYDYNDFLAISKGLENVKEGGERCFKCYEMRMEVSAKYAKEQGFEYFCTTLTISPLKNAEKINEIGMKLSQKYNIKWLPSDFKKRNGFKRSVELSKQYNLYRQNYCGCIFSKNNKGNEDNNE